MAIKYNPPKQKTVKSYQEYLADLENLLKRNTGQGLYVGQDVSSNTPMYFPGKVRNPGGIGESAPSIAQAGNGMTEMPDNTPEPRGIGQILGDNTQMTMTDFLDSWEQSTQPQQSIEAVSTTQDGGTLASDGNIYYEDGTVRQGDPNAYAIASLPGGGYKYSDGSTREQEAYAIASAGTDESGTPLVLYTDGSLRYGSMDGITGTGGLGGLVTGIFGQDRTITQDYGNINPIEPTPGNVNYGTDIRTRDLTGQSRQLKIPVNAEVVEVYQDDGTQFGTRSGHKGYGNSVLLRLPSGEMIRLSHLSEMSELVPGQTIQAGTVIGTPGTTGNTAGEHLDLEYYNQEGKISNPSSFSGFNKPSNPENKAPGTVVQNAPANQSNQPIQSNPPIQPNAPVQSNPVNQSNPVQQNQPVNQTSQPSNKVADAIGYTGSLANPFLSPEQKVVAKQESNKALDSLGFNPAGTAGFQEVLMGDIPAAGRELSQTIERENPGSKIDLGISEMLRGDKEGAKKVLTDTFNRAGNKVKEVASNIFKGVPKAVAAESQPGTGVSDLASDSVSSLENVFKPKINEEKRAIGDVKGTAEPTQAGQFSSVMDTASSMAGLAKNDIRDPFFKMGGADMFKQFLAPGVDSNYQGALGLDTFTPDFFKDLGNISSVFGGSKDLNAATSKYIDYERAKYPKMSRMSGGDGYDQGQVDQYNREVDAYNQSVDNYLNGIMGGVSGSQSIFTPRLAGSAKNVFSGASSPVRQTVAPKTNIPVPTISRPTQSNPATNNASMNGKPVTVGQSQNNASQNGQAVYKPAPKQAPVQNKSIPISQGNMSRNGQVVYVPQQSKPNTATQSKPKNNVFSSIKNVFNNIFRK